MTSPSDRPPATQRPRRRGVLAALFAEATPLDLRIVGRMLIHAALVGAAAGLMAAAFFGALEIGEELFLELIAGYTPLRAAGEMVDKAHHGQPFRPWFLVLLPAAGAMLATALVRRWAPECHGAGEDAFIRAFHQQQSHMRKRVVWIKPLATLLTLATGGAGGREGPTAQTGAAIGSTVASYLHLSNRERRILLVAGAAAGTAAIFRTPLGASLLAVEVLYRDDFESDALIPAVLASVIGYSLFISLYGEANLFETAARYPFHPSHLPFYAVLAVALSLLAVFFVKVRASVEQLLGRLPAWTRPGVGGLALGVLATTIVMVNQPGVGLGILGGGYGAAQLAITGADWLPVGGGAVQLLLLLCVAKIAAASFTLGSGASAGVFAPALAIGALFGGAFGLGVEQLVDVPDLDPGAFALVGMGTFFGGIAHAPLGALVMVCEMAGSYDLLVPLMLAEGIAFAALRRHTLYPSQLPSVHDSPAHPQKASLLLERMCVTDVLVSDRPFVSFGPATPMSQVIQQVSQTSWQDVFPVLEDDKLVGMITPELLRLVAAERDIEPWLLAADTMQPPVTVRPDENLRLASERMLSTGLRELLVVDDSSTICGFLDEAEIAQCYLVGDAADE